MNAEHPQAPTVRIYRPKTVAQFLRRLPVDQRHEAVNALCLLGLDAFASSGLFNHDTWREAQTYPERLADNLHLVAKESEHHLNAHIRSISSSSSSTLLDEDDMAEDGVEHVDEGRLFAARRAGGGGGGAGAVVDPARSPLNTESRLVSPGRKPTPPLAAAQQQQQQEQHQHERSMSAPPYVSPPRSAGRKHISPPAPSQGVPVSRRKAILPGGTESRSQSIEFSTRTVSPQRPAAARGQLPPPPHHAYDYHKSMTSTMVKHNKPNKQRAQQQQQQQQQRLQGDVIPRQIKPAAPRRTVSPTAPKAIVPRRQQQHQQQQHVQYHQPTSTQIVVVPPHRDQVREPSQKKPSHSAVVVRASSSSSSARPLSTQRDAEQQEVNQQQQQPQQQQQESRTISPRRNSNATQQHPPAVAENNNNKAHYCDPDGSPRGTRNAAIKGMAAKLRSEAEGLLAVARRIDTNDKYNPTAAADRSAVRSPSHRRNNIDIRDFVNSQRQRMQSQRELDSHIDDTIIKVPAYGILKKAEVAAIEDGSTSNSSLLPQHHSSDGGAVAPMPAAAAAGGEGDDRSGVVGGGSGRAAPLVPLLAPHPDDMLRQHQRRDQGETSSVNPPRSIPHTDLLNNSASIHGAGGSGENLLLHGEASNATATPTISRDEAQEPMNLSRSDYGRLVRSHKVSLTQGDYDKIVRSRGTNTGDDDDAAALSSYRRRPLDGTTTTTTGEESGGSYGTTTDDLRDFANAEPISSRRGSGSTPTVRNHSFGAMSTHSWGYAAGGSGGGDSASASRTSVPPNISPPRRVTALDSVFDHAHLYDGALVQRIGNTYNINNHSSSGAMSNNYPPPPHLNPQQQHSTSSYQQHPPPFSHTSVSPYGRQQQRPTANVPPLIREAVSVGGSSSNLVSPVRRPPAVVSGGEFGNRLTTGSSIATTAAAAGGNMPYHRTYERENISFDTI